MNDDGYFVLKFCDFLQKSQVIIYNMTYIFS